MAISFRFFEFQDKFAFFLEEHTACSHVTIGLMVRGLIVVRSAGVSCTAGPHRVV